MFNSSKNFAITPKRKEDDEVSRFFIIISKIIFWGISICGVVITIYRTIALYGNMPSITWSCIVDLIIYIDKNKNLSLIYLCWLLFCLLYKVIYYYEQLHNLRKFSKTKQSISQGILPCVGISILLFHLNIPLGLAPYIKIFNTPTPWLSKIGMAFLSIGLIIVSWGRISLGGYWSKELCCYDSPNIKPVTIGAYKYFKHPIYFGLLTMSYGTVFIINSLWMFFLIVVFHIFIVCRISIEERHLTKTFGDPYKKFLGPKSPRFKKQVQFWKNLTFLKINYNEKL